MKPTIRKTLFATAAFSAAALIAAPSIANNTQDALQTGANGLANEINDTIFSWLPRTEGSVTFDSELDPVYGLLTLQPLYSSNDLTHTFFLQGSLFHSDDVTTGNIGLGYRALVWEKRLLWGLNTFYDHEWPNDHQRSSVGLEILTSPLEFRANYYDAVSGWQNVGGGFEERALGGYDVEVGAALPYLPHMRAYAKRFIWEGLDGLGDQEGTTLSLFGEFVPGFTIEGGHTDLDNGEDSQFVRIGFDVVKMAKTDDFKFVADEAYAFREVEHKRLDRVRRSNLIKKQRRAIGGGSSSSTFTSTVSGA